MKTIANMIWNSSGIAIQMTLGSWNSASTGEVLRNLLSTKASTATQKPHRKNRQERNRVHGPNLRWVNRSIPPKTRLVQNRW